MAFFPTVSTAEMRPLLISLPTVRLGEEAALFPTAPVGVRPLLTSNGGGSPTDGQAQRRFARL